jgi:hypothetical protein
MLPAEHRHVLRDGSRFRPCIVASARRRGTLSLFAQSHVGVSGVHLPRDLSCHRKSSPVGHPRGASSPAALHDPRRRTRLRAALRRQLRPIHQASAPLLRRALRDFKRNRSATSSVTTSSAYTSNAVATTGLSSALSRRVSHRARPRGRAAALAMAHAGNSSPLGQLPPLLRTWSHGLGCLCRGIARTPLLLFQNPSRQPPNRRKQSRRAGAGAPIRYYLDPVLLIAVVIIGVATAAGGSTAFLPTSCARPPSGSAPTTRWRPGY